MKVNERWLATLLVAVAVGFGLDMAGCDGQDNPEPDADADADADADTTDSVPDPDVVDSPDDSVPDPDVVDDDAGCVFPPTCPNAPADHSSMGMACMSVMDCEETLGEQCITESTESYDGEEYVSWVGGTCIMIAAAGEGCDPDVPSSCPTGSRCIFMYTDSDTFIEYYSCLDACAAADTSWNPYDWACGCRRGYSCSINAEVCLPGCTNDRECCELWDNVDDDQTRDPGEVTIDPDCTNTCDGDDPTEYSTDCRASFACINNGDPEATYQSPCVYDSDCPADARCLNELYYYDLHTLEPYYPGGLCLRDACQLVGRGCGTDLLGECVNLGSPTDPFYACWASCQTGYGPGDPLNPCRDDDMTRAYACSPYPSSYWLSPSTIGADGLCFPAVINDVTTPNLGETCVDESTCYSPLGLGACWTAMGVSICTVSCNQSLAEDQSICGAPASAGEVAPGVCIGLCVAGCSTPLGALGSNGCPTVDQACYPNDGSYNGGDIAFRDSTATDPAGFCLPACATNADCADFWSGATNCNTTSGVCGM